VNVGRRVRPLGPSQVEIAAPREVVFEVIAEPYLRRQTRAIAAATFSAVQAEAERRSQVRGERRPS
jgi:hypothetical protein